MSFHLFRINELYSNASGSIQFIELAIGNINGESFWQNQSIEVTQGAAVHSLTFTKNLPNPNTANKSVLIATQGFADLNIVTPDFIIPDGFLFTSGSATVDFAGADAVTYAVLPSNGLHSINRDGVVQTNSPTNFAGTTGTVPSNTIFGTNGPDQLTGTNADNVIDAGGDNDRLNGLLGNDLLNGGTGIDTAVYSQNKSDYSISPNKDGLTVTGPDGTDTLINIERLNFLDKDLAFDLAKEQSAGNTVRIIGAAFDANNIIPEYVAIGLQLFDSGQSLLSVSELVVNSALFQSMTGSSSNEAFVNHVYRNVVGALPSESERDLYVGMLKGSGGTLTQAELLTLAANATINETNIDLVGLVQNGVEFSV